MSLIFEIVIFSLLAIGSAFTKSVSLPFAIEILLSSALTIAFVSHIVFYILSINSELKSISVKPYHKFISFSLLTISKLNRNFILSALLSSILLGFVLNFNELKTYDATAGLIGFVVTPILTALELALCFVFIFISNKLDTYTMKFFTNRLLYPLSLANLFISQLFFLLIQSLTVYGYANASSKLFNEIPALDNLFDNPILFDFIYSLL